MPKKSDKRQQTAPLQIRMKEGERAYIEKAAQKLSAESPAVVGVGPFMRWASLRESERILGIGLADFEAQEAKRGKGGR